MCHKPGIIGYLLESHDGSFRSYGQFSFSAGLAGLNTFAAERDGFQYIEFADGVKYQLGCPKLEVHNIIYGEHALNVMSGHSLIKDLKNHIVADVFYNPH